MSRTKARFRISIKDHHTKTSLRVELIDAIGLWGERRYRILLNVSIDGVRPLVASIE